MSENAVKILGLRKQCRLIISEIMMTTDRDRYYELRDELEVLHEEIKILESENCKNAHKQIRQMLGK